MVLTVCPNPCLDCTIELESLNVGRLNRVENKMISYAGKALNVAVGVARLGQQAYATGFMFDNDGKLFEQKLENEFVKHRFVWNKGSARVNYKIIDKKSMLTEINDRGENVPVEKQEELIALVAELSKEADVVVVSGSLPYGVKSSFYREIFSVVPKNAFKICDTERDNMREAVKCGIDLVKPNHRELEKYVGRELHSREEIIDAAGELINDGAKKVIVSLGVDGAIFVGGEKVLYCRSMNVAVNSTVGAGDAMLAAASCGVELGATDEDLLRMSVAAGTAAVTTGGTNLFYKEKYREVYNNIHVEAL